MLKPALTLLSALCSAAALSTPAVVRPCRASMSRACVFATETAEATATEATSKDCGAKDALLSLLLDGLGMAADKRAEVSEVLLRVESANPTPEPSQSLLFNGVWELRYAGAPGPGLIDSPTRELALALYTTGFSAGGLISFLSKLPAPLAATASLDGTTVTITSLEAGQPRVSTKVDLSLFGAAQTINFASNLQPSCR